jgi:geranylgeranyl diphosphate synthase, type II
MNIKEYLAGRKELIEKAIPSLMPKGGKYTNVLRDAALYSLMSGGKRIRPVMTLASCEAVSGSYKKAVPLAVAIEMIHTYTLIHDDLPAMDDDDTRRGKPTCHKKFGEDMAILAGDMLNTLAFQIIAGHYTDKASSIIIELGQTLGINGVVGGQAADLKAKGRKIGRDELDFIDTRKTAYLFIASVVCGGMVGGANNKELADLGRYAEHLGLAFQITDDILDHASGESSGYPAVLGMDRSKLEAKAQIASAVRALPRKGSFSRLKEIALFITDRKE